MTDNPNMVRDTVAMAIHIARGMWRYRWRAALVA